MINYSPYLNLGKKFLSPARRAIKWYEGKKDSVRIEGGKTQSQVNDNNKHFQLDLAKNGPVK